MPRRSVSGVSTKAVLWLSIVCMFIAAGCEPNPVLRRKGIDAFHAGEVTQADRHFTKAVRQDPTDWKSLYYLGKVRLEQDRALDATLVLEKALSLRNDHEQTPQILDALAQSLYQQGETARLHTMLQRAIDEYETSRDFLRLAKFMGKTGDRDSAKVALRKATYFARPGDATPWLALADFYESLDDTDQTIDALRRALAINPRSRQVRTRLRKYGIVPGPTVQIKQRPGDNR